ncbi:MAG: riboflavin synthase [Magnetococcales bacterium]|nr:riboflavin synthase [Magnetococcales bacterium]
MFTGLIEDLGTVHAIQKGSEDWNLTVGCAMPMDAITLGDSIAVNGACLTVVDIAADRFTVQVSAETVRRTHFQEMQTGNRVNLERALQVGGRLDGHLVQGHVDAVGQVSRMTPRGRSIEVWFQLPSSAGRYVVAKGSIAVDGVSLTVNAVQDMDSETRFSVNIISHTQTKTTLATMRVGQNVNIETDLIGRYVERLMGRGTRCPTGGVDEAWLRKRGIL